MARPRLLVFIFVTFFTLLTPSFLFAFDVAGWMPYWRKAEGIASVRPYLKSHLTQVSPFSFEVKKDGTLRDAMKISEEPWKEFLIEARKNKVKIYPTVFWGDRDSIEIVLSDVKKRKAHREAIMQEIKKFNFDGIDIDYENKSAESNVYFSLFLTELQKDLKKEKKKLICTIEARTPLDSRYSTVTPEKIKEIEYANDYKVIGKVCDQVRVMAYDQSDIDVRLNVLYKKELYRPVADREWVMKVLTLTLRDIPANKIVVGVPTYGYKYEVIIGIDGAYRYEKIGSMNFVYADALAKSLSIIPSRNRGGELSFIYSSTTESSNKDGSTRTYLVSYSDAKAIEEKVKLAKLYKLGGVSIFKLDGGFDPLLWEALGKK